VRRGRFDFRDCVALRRSRRSESPIGGLPKRWRRKNGLELCRHRGLRLYSLVEAPFTGITDVCVLLFSLHTSWIIACRPPKFASKSAKVQRTFSKDRARSSHCRPLHRHARFVLSLVWFWLPSRFELHHMLTQRRPPCCCTGPPSKIASLKKAPGLK
jgi:hypothetical protein